jgi:DNA repair protein RadC
MLMHNHASGDSTLSQTNVQTTRAIVGIARLLGNAVHDHIIVGKSGHSSLRRLKLMQSPRKSRFSMANPVH